MAWVLHCFGIEHQIHYLDDFLFLVVSGSHSAGIIRSIVLHGYTVCRILNIPVAEHKTEGPNTCLEFLSIPMPSSCTCHVQGLACLQDLLQVWSVKCTCTRRELKLFLDIYHRQNLLEATLSPYFTWGEHPTSTFVSMRVQERICYGGKSFSKIGTALLSFLQTEVFLDASGTYRILFSLWVVSGPVAIVFHIAAKELVPIVGVAAIWGNRWTRSRTCFKSDNMAVVEVLRSHTSRDGLLMHLLRCFVFYVAYTLSLSISRGLSILQRMLSRGITSHCFILLFHRFHSQC